MPACILPCYHALEFPALSRVIAQNFSIGGESELCGLWSRRTPRRQATKMFEFSACSFHRATLRLRSGITPLPSLKVNDPFSAALLVTLGANQRSTQQPTVQGTHHTIESSHHGTSNTFEFWSIANQHVEGINIPSILNDIGVKGSRRASRA
jgi:hypothetical protein